MVTPSPRLALVVFAHGSRDPEWRRPFDRLVEALRVEGVADHVALAFLEFDEPGIEAAIDAADPVGDDPRLFETLVAIGRDVGRDRV